MQPQRSYLMHTDHIRRIPALPGNDSLTSCPYRRCGVAFFRSVRSNNLFLTEVRCMQHAAWACLAAQDTGFFIGDYFIIVFGLRPLLHR